MNLTRPKLSKDPGPFDADPLAALRRHNLTQSFYVETKTPGDGNCFYHAVLDQIKHNPRIYDTLSEIGQQCTTAHQLRVNCNQYINCSQLLHQNETFLNVQMVIIDELRATNPAKYPANITDDEVWTMHTVQRSKSGVYAEDIFITYMATFLRKDIVITAASNPHIWTILHSFSGSSGPPITLASNTHPLQDCNCLSS